MNFVQTSSIVSRFRTLTIGLGLFLLLEFAGIFISSQTLLKGLRELNQVNTLTALSSKGVLNLTSAIETVEKEMGSPSLPPKQLQIVYQTAETQAAEAIENALRLNPQSATIKRLFTDAKTSLEELNRVTLKLFLILETRTPQQKEQIKKQLLLVKQLEQDVSESLRQAHIELSKLGDETFSNVYRSRLKPLLVSFGLAIFFFIFVLLVGFNTTRRLSRSLGNLLRATEEVAQGNLNIQVPVFAKDEIGRLTSAFDEMVKNLAESLKNTKISSERTMRLQAITAEFSRALDPKAIADTIVTQGIAELGASAGAVCTYTENRKALRILSSSGYPAELVQAWAEFPLDRGLPTSESVLQKTSFFIESKQELKSRFPRTEDAHSHFPEALAVMPLLVGNEAIGALNFSFDTQRFFTQKERDFITTLADLSSQAFQRAQLYADAQKAIHMRDEFLSIASHELKTPITSLKMQLQLAHRQTKPEENLAPTPERLSKVFETSIHQVDRLTSLVEDLLDVSRIEAGKLSFEMTEFDLQETLKAVLERFEGVLTSSKSKIELTHSEPVLILADAFRIEQVIVNLVANALKYGAGNPIQISLQKENNQAKLSVKDQGIGIPIEKQGLIFDRFERAENTQNIGGLGLGLYIAKQIVLALDGTIQVKSEVGKGSEFTVGLKTLT